MTRIAAGLDFGTSNSAIGYAHAGDRALHRFASGDSFIPSALFHDDEDRCLRFGSEAERCFLAGDDGRYLRALKSILGTRLIEETTVLGGRPQAFRDLLRHFLAFMKDDLEARLDAPVSRLVAGRPVRFGHDDTADARAQSELNALYRAVGFQEVTFLHEPVAALYDAASAMRAPRHVLVADIGGGTSDFTVARNRGAGDVADHRDLEILANTGVRVGGTDLDRELSLTALMPRLGFGSTYSSPLSNAVLPIPSYYYTELASWHLIPFFYARARRDKLRDFQRTAEAPERLERLIEVAERRLGHRLAAGVERAKIALGAAQRTDLQFDDLPALGRAGIDADTLAEAIGPSLAAIRDGIDAALAEANLERDAIDHLVLTGGTTLLPAVRETIAACVPAARSVESDPFCAVVNGLTRAAARFEEHA